MRRYFLVDRTLPGRRLELATRSASVAVAGWAQDGIRVQATQLRGEVGDFALDVRQSGEVVRADDREEARTPSGAGLAYVVSVPAVVELRIVASSGSVQVEGVAGVITIRAGSGSVRACGIAGTLDVATASGSVDIAESEVSRAELRSSSGSIALQGVAAVATLTTASGSIRVREARCELLAIASGSGSIEYASAPIPGSTTTMRAQSGSVIVRLPLDANVRLHAGTRHGRIHNAFRFREEQQRAGMLVGTAGDGRAILRITAGSGSLTIEPIAPAD